MDVPRQFSGDIFLAIAVGATIVTVCYIIVWPGTRVLLLYFRCKFFHKWDIKWRNGKKRFVRCTCGQEWEL